MESEKEKIKYLEHGYNSGYVERKESTKYEGVISIDGVSLGAIIAVYFTQQNKHFLWLKRKPMLEYDHISDKYTTKTREPQWEVYMERQNNDVIAYKGTFVFLHFKYSIIGIWDKVEREAKNRLNLYVERLPLEQQNIINEINKRKKHDTKY